ncbi:helix-turn-helix transcriptional regulator [Mesorhizobium australafricanum]|uniref:Helix-turn-helix transcriptional regulator n=1 Tax=Mesorhizobium australafricanum TaxID=3072311 RepID=A0ABU4X2A5_9HYPH|nr:helix-turn-helix transcriptional regulator [Mesorhizobium sp. VK3E]MDX8441638.1 helix-turn-helix transcriptional regulator [Mesorhizobium sp. VK3E]
MTPPQLSNEEHVALCLRELRTRLRITQKDLAKDMGTTPQIVSRWEKGKQPFSVEQMSDLCMTLNCMTDQLLGRDNGLEEWANCSANSGTDVQYGTLKVKTTVGTRKYPINEYARTSILCQLRLLNNIPSNHNNRQWIYCTSLNNKIVIINPACVKSIDMVGDDAEAIPQYYRPEVYRAFDDLDVGEISEKLRDECQIIIAEIGEEEAMRMVSYVRVTYDNGEDEWNFLDGGSATTFFGLEAATFDIPQCTFAKIEEEGYYWARYANLDHVAVMEIPSDLYHKLTRNRPNARQ